MRTAIFSMVNCALHKSEETNLSRLYNCIERWVEGGSKQRASASDLLKSSSATCAMAKKTICTDELKANCLPISVAHAMKKRDLLALTWLREIASDTGHRGPAGRCSVKYRASK